MAWQDYTFSPFNWDGQNGTTEVPPGGVYPSYPSPYASQVLNVAAMPQGVEYEAYQVNWDWVNPYAYYGGNANDAVMALVAYPGATADADYYTPIYNQSNPPGGQGSIFTRPGGLGYGPWSLEVSGPIEADPGSYYVGGTPLAAQGWQNAYSYYDSTHYTNVTVKMYQKRDYLLQETFESGMPAGWTTGGNYSWYAPGSYNYTKGSGSALTVGDGNTIWDPDAWVNSAPFVVPGSNSEAVFDWCFYPDYTYLTDAGLEVRISTDGGQSWTQLFAWHNELGQGMARLRDYIPIGQYAGQTAMIQFWVHDFNHQYSGQDKGAWIDNFGITMPEPTSLVLLALGGLGLLRRR